MMVIVAIYGGAQAFFDPASDAILPELVPDVAARRRPTRSSRSCARSRCASPGRRSAECSSACSAPGAAFLADARDVPRLRGDAVGDVRARVRSPPAAPARSSSARTRARLREGWSYVRGHVWLWGTFASAGIAYLLFMGPAEVLLPFMVKHVLRGSGVQLGLVLGAGGLGSVAAALAMTRSGLPARSMTFIYVVWTLAHARGRRLRAGQRRSGS